jgi:hypothetical protein
MNDEVKVVSIDNRENYVFASDGAKFDNSVPGRVNLQRYEDRLKRVK